MIYNQGTKPQCPHCGKVQEDPIEDFVIPGQVGERSRAETECGWCDESFAVEHREDGTYELTKA